MLFDDPRLCRPSGHPTHPFTITSPSHLTQHRLRDRHLAGMAIAGRFRAQQGGGDGDSGGRGMLSSVHLEDAGGGRNVMMLQFH